MKREFLHLFVYITLGMMFISILTVFYWLNAPYDILTFKDKQFPVITKQVKQGGVLRFLSRFCKNISLPAETSGAFIDGIIFNVPTVMTNRDIGCQTIIVQIKIPDELPIGKIYFQRLYKFKPNPIRIITYTHRTEVFEVMESTKSAELRLKDE